MRDRCALALAIWQALQRNPTEGRSAQAKIQELPFPGSLLPVRDAPAPAPVVFSCRALIPRCSLGTPLICEAALLPFPSRPERAL